MSARLQARLGSSVLWLRLACIGRLSEIRTEFPVNDSRKMVRYTCPHCSREVAVARREDLPSRPFCSKRCQQIDLGRWLNEEYVISDSLLPTDPTGPDSPNGEQPTDPGSNA
jgi:endogenous inhibitor of DNA gyrase (YacG/DUF329 family)